MRNKIEGSEVMCTIIDESAEKNKRPNRYEIYYGIKDNKLNLIHFHVLDKDLRNVKMIIKEIGIKEDPHVLKKSEEYIKNNQLLLITQGQNILKLYYKGKKVKMSKEVIDEFTLSAADKDFTFLSSRNMPDNSKTRPSSLSPPTRAVAWAAACPT